MMLRTHLMITLFFVLLLISNVTDKFIFVLVAVIATYIPDVDSRFSKLGRRRLARVLQFFTKHRGVIHSFTFLILLTLVFVLFLPVVALGFFLGYGLHLLADSFTVQGVTPFWPFRNKSCGIVHTGGKTEIIVLVSFIIADLVLGIWWVGGLF